MRDCITASSKKRRRFKVKYNIIAIEREYASGGNEIGERTAKRLDIPCYGQEVLNRAAKLMKTVPERLLHLCLLYTSPSPRD